MLNQSTATLAPITEKSLARFAIPRHGDKNSKKKKELTKDKKVHHWNNVGGFSPEKSTVPTLESGESGDEATRSRIHKQQKGDPAKQQRMRDIKGLLGYGDSDDFDRPISPLQMRSPY
jgi:hypothetical protein